MPTYEYACKKCEEHVEVVQSFKDDPLTECPACGGPLRKVFGNIGIAFKGSGFYKTDSRSAATASKAAASGGGDKSSSSSDGGGSGSSGGSGRRSAQAGRNRAAAARPRATARRLDRRLPSRRRPSPPPRRRPSRLPRWRRPLARPRPRSRSSGGRASTDGWTTPPTSRPRRRTACPPGPSRLAWWAVVRWRSWPDTGLATRCLHTP